MDSRDKKLESMEKDIDKRIKSIAVLVEKNGKQIDRWQTITKFLIGLVAVAGTVVGIITKL